MNTEFNILFQANVQVYIHTWTKKFYCSEEKLESHIDNYLNNKKFILFDKQDIRWKII